MKRKFCKDYVRANEFLSYVCLRENKIDLLQTLIEEGLPVTPFVLTLMEYFKCSKATIKETLLNAYEIDGEAFLCLGDYLDTDDSRAIFQKFEDMLPINISDDMCVTFGLWNTLLNRKKYKLLAQHAPDVLFSAGLSEDRIYALLEVDFAKYVDLAYDNGKLFQILAIKDGWKYLVDKGHADYVLRHIKTINDLKLLAALQMDEIKEYCYKKGFVDELFNAGCFDFLLEKGEFEMFVERHVFYENFISQYPEKVDWEDLWKHYRRNLEYRKLLKNIAKKNISVQKCRNFLWNHSGIFGKLKLLSS